MDDRNHTKISAVIVLNEKGEQDTAELHRAIYLDKPPGLPEYRYKGAACQRDGDHLTYGAVQHRLKIVSHPD